MHQDLRMTTKNSAASRVYKKFSRANFRRNVYKDSLHRAESKQIYNMEIKFFHLRNMLFNLQAAIYLSPL